MMIQLISDNKFAKGWFCEYQFGPFPMSHEFMKRKELELRNKILECKVDSAPFIYNNNYEMFAVVKSKLNPASISKEEWDEFQLTVARNVAAKNQLKG